MKHNYHTHTARCNHANGTEREYIEKALAEGLETLGFSDHAPYVFEGSYYSGFRMRPELFADYCSCIRELKEEYKGRINILVGLEAEYYPKFFDKFLALIEPFEPDYLILGQHFLDNEMEGRYSGEPTTDRGRLADYIAQLIAGMETGKFSYVAHPDLIGFRGDDDIYLSEISKLFDASKRLGIPLEINQLGVMDHRFYPRRLFWQFAGYSGCKVVTGCDAHSPKWIADPEILKQTADFASGCGVKIDYEPLVLRKP